MNLATLEADLYRRLGFAATPATEVITRLRAFLNETQQELLSTPGLEALLNDVVTVASVASTPEYSLPQVVARITQIRDTANRWKLDPLSESDWRARVPDPTALTGVPGHYIDLGVAAVALQPSAAAELFVISDSASDGATKTAFIEGYITGGYFRAASAVLNGITGVSFGATITTWIQVTKFYLALGAGGTTTAAGNVTLRQTSGAGTELARIPIGQSYAKYRRIGLYPTPAAVLTYTVDFERDAQDMSQATDEPLIPVRFHRLLGVGARMREYEKQDDRPRYLAAQQEYLFGIKQLKYFLASQVAGSPNLRGHSVARPSRLGAWFPANV